ncbi:HD domain-containing protein, partial [candidate division KSB1 bacterium]
MGEIRDPIYGFITPNETEFKIINTKIFQRLRRIKQLAMAYLVYPGANHTRFDHSVGVYHLASLMADKLLPSKQNEERRRIVRLAALLHDIGHGPFSHVSEDILNKFSDSTSNTSKEKIHEEITAKLIDNNEELKKLISPEDRKSIIGLLNGKNVDITLMKDIVSGPLDADKMDYLLRDSYFCGVKYGVFDLDRMLNTIYFYKENDDKHIAIKYDGINSLEQFVLAKYYMTIQVYRHKVRTLTDSMIIRGLELGMEKDEIDFLNKLYRYN